MAAPSLVQTPVVAVAAGTSNTSISATYGSTPTEGSLLVAGVLLRSAKPIDTPSGWTGHPDNVINLPGFSIFFKTAGASEPTTVTIEVTTPETDKLVLIILEYADADTSDPWDGAAAILATGGSSGLIVVSAFLPSQDDSTLVCFARLNGNIGNNNPATFASVTFTDAIAGFAGGGASDIGFNFGQRRQTTATSEGTTVDFDAVADASGWIHAIKPVTAFQLQRQAIIDGLTSAQSEADGWNAKVRDIALQPSDVVRTSDTVVTITLPAVSDYVVTADETITATIPAAALVGTTELIANPTFDVIAATGAALVEILNEAVSIVEASNKTKLVTKAINETQQLVESLVSIRAQVRFINETIQIAETVDKTKLIAKAINESISIIEVIISTLGKTLVIDETVNVIEALLKPLTLLRLLTESISITDTQVKVQAIIRLINEVEQVVEVITKAALITKSVNETINIIETIVKIVSAVGLDLVRIIDEQTQFLENIDKTVAILQIISEAINIVESFNKTKLIRKSIDETLFIVDNWSRAAVLIRLITESITEVETLITVRDLNRFINETQSINEALIASRTLVKAISEAVQLGETTAKIIGAALTGLVLALIKVFPAASHLTIELKTAVAATIEVNKDI